MRSELLLAVLLLLSAAPGQVLARWSFDEAEGDLAKDSGPDGLDGKLQGKVQRVDGMQGGALHFVKEPVGWVQLPKAAQLNLQPPFTLAAWIRPEIAGTTMAILSKQGDVEPLGYRLRFFWRMLDFRCGDGTDKLAFTSPKYTIPAGYWCHVAVTLDGQTVRRHRNAEAIYEAPGPAKLADNPHAAVLGSFVGRKDAYHFVGDLDEVVILRKALGTEELYRLAAGRE